MRTTTLLLLLAGGLSAGCGLGDVEETEDFDGDGLSDAEESDLGTDPTLSDRDGVDDGQESVDGTDPLDPEDYEGAEEEVAERWPTAPCEITPEAIGQNQVGQIAHNVEGLDQFGDPISLYDYCDMTVLMLGGGFG